jgi:hypothetical protein
MKKMLLLLGLFCFLAVSGCNNEGTMERGGKKLDKAGEAAKDSMEKAKKRAEDSLNK